MSQYFFLIQQNVPVKQLLVYNKHKKTTVYIYHNQHTRTQARTHKLKHTNTQMHARTHARMIRLRDTYGNQQKYLAIYQNRHLEKDFLQIKLLLKSFISFPLIKCKLLVRKHLGEKEKGKIRDHPLCP